MNELIIPTAPNWYSPSIIACAPDNTLVYAGHSKQLILIEPREDSKPAKIIVTKGHNDKIVAIAINSKTWGLPNKLVAFATNDNVVKINYITSNQVSTHSEHQKIDKGKLVSVCFSGERVISVTQFGYIIIWLPSTDEKHHLPNIFGEKVQITCMSSCPHATWLTAFGTYKGSVFVADLRRGGKIRHKLQQHNSSITNLSWCPAPINIFEGNKDETISVLKTKTIVRNETPSENKEHITGSSTELNNAETLIDIKQDEPNDENVILLDIKQDEPNDENVILIDIKQDEPNDENAILIDIKQDEPNDENIMEEITKIEIPRYEPRQENIYKKADKINPWGNIVYNDSDEEIPIQRDLPTRNSPEFLEECEYLRDVILGNEEILVKNNDILAENNEILVENNEILAEKNEILAENNEILVENNENKDMTSSDLKERIANITSDVQELQLDSPDIQQKDVTNITIQKRFIIEDADQEYLLASTCVNGAICIWKTCRHGKLQLKLNNFEKKRSKSDSVKKWSCIYWVKPDILLSSGPKHEIYSINLLSETRNKSHKNANQLDVRLVHGDHSKAICGITSPYKLYDSLDKTVDLHSLNEFKVWTASNDRWVICSSLGPDRKVYASYPTFGDKPEFFAVSPIDPYKVALGMFESNTKLWDLNNTQTQIITMKLMQGVGGGSVTYLDWHPLKEYCLAFGSSRGNVGVIDANNLSKAANTYKNFHTANVYKVQWGPFPSSDDFGLYSCSGGQLVVHNPNNTTSDPLTIDINNTSVTTFSWATDYTKLAVGSKEGHVKLLSKDLVVYETLFRQKKSVQCVQWHPQSTANDSGLSPFCNYLAVSTNENDIYIYNCLPINEKSTSNSSELIAVLKGHTHRVKDLNWNTLVGGRLLSLSEMGLLHIWDVPSKIIIASKRVNRYCNSIWSPLVSDLVISFDAGGFLQIWDIKKYLPIFDNPSEKSDTIVNVSEVSESNTSTTNKIAKKLRIMPEIGRLQSRQNLDTCKKLISIMANKQEESSDSEDDIPPTKSDSSVIVEPVQLFGNKNDAIAILRSETESHVIKHDWDAMVHIGLWRGDLVECLERAVKSGIINEWMIQVAPMVSHTLYAQLCEKYAEKLADNGEALQAASYYLLCHKLMTAIDILCNANLHKEALILAKVRLPLFDPTINKIYERWAKYTTIVGNYEEAAQCLIKLGRPAEAAEFLNKRNNIDVLNIACDLAESSKNHDLFLTIKTKIESLKPVEEQLDSSVVHVSESRLDAMLQMNDIVSEIDKDVVQFSSATMNEDVQANDIVSEIDKDVVQFSSATMNEDVQASTTTSEDPNQEIPTGTTD